jgi:predicted O-methyltransferase YrrM
MRQQKPLYSLHYPSFSPFDRAALRQLASRLDPGFTILEIGSWLGQGSTAVLIAEAKKKLGVVYCVDTWMGNPNVEKHQHIVRQYDVLGTFLHNVATAGGQQLVRTLVMPSAEAAGIVRDAAFDLVFIDADHSYASTLHDVRAWLPKVKPGGILCGHDCEGRIADFGRERLQSGLDRDTIPGNQQFREVHAGVIMACHEIFEDRHQLFAETPIQAEDGSIGRSTIWFVRV